MTVLTFPSNPQNGNTYSAPNGVLYRYDGIKWIAQNTTTTGTIITDYLQDSVAPILTNIVSDNISFSYDDNTNTLSASVNSFNQNLNTTDDVTFNQVQLSNIRTSGSGYITLSAGVTDTIYTIPNWMVSNKLVICAESELDSDGTHTRHTQTCEATIAATYNYSNEPVISVYGLVYTSPEPLATFSARRNNGGDIEIVATNTQGSKSMTFSVYATQFISVHD